MGQKTQGGACCCAKTLDDLEGVILVTKDDFIMYDAIGRGGFGKVLKVEALVDGKIYAMKEMLKARVMAKKSIESVMMELQLMQKIKSNFIVNV